MATDLSEPYWTDTAELCFCCGYCLRGLPAPGRCPECGTHFDAQQLILSGVPQSGAGLKPGRMFAWGVTGFLFIVFIHAWPFLFIYSWMIGTGVFVALLTAIVVLIKTSRRERSGTERFILTPSGVARLPARDSKDGKVDSLFVPWNGANEFELKRVSRTWYRIRVGTASSQKGRLAKVVFDAGFRCTDEWAPYIRGVLLHYLNGGVAPIARPIDL